MERISPHRWGWYNLDPLWACDAIDVIGIDAYFPLTDTESCEDLIEKAIEGWDSGECYDYYYEDEARTKRPHYHRNMQ